MSLDKVAISAEQMHKVQLFKSRMLEFSNPVEFVNNMYGCHPGDGGRDGEDGGYFGAIYGK